MDLTGNPIVLDYLFQFSLFFANFAFLGPLLIVGTYCIDRKAFLNIMLMCFLSTFINAYLKSIWQIPLDPSLKKVGWAFPSGHTQFGVVLWLTLLYQIRKWWIAVVTIILSIASYFGMIHFHYHNWYDILAGVFFGVLTFLLFVLWDYLFKNRQLEFCISGILISIFILFILPPQPHKYLWLFIYLGMYSGLFLYLLLERFGYITIVSKPNSKNLLESLLTVSFMYLINLITTGSQTAMYFKGLSLAAVSLLLIPYVKILLFKR
jgi:undecaprenyl-diphosphatase